MHLNILKYPWVTSGKNFTECHTNSAGKTHLFYDDQITNFDFCTLNTHNTSSCQLLVLLVIDITVS